MKDNAVKTKSYAFALQIIDLYKTLVAEKKEFVLSKQLLRSGTSIGANVAEAIGGISPADFSAKISIGYKEVLETQYWLSLLHDSGYLEDAKFNLLHANCEELGKILFYHLKNNWPHKPVNND